MKVYYYTQLDSKQIKRLAQRPAVNYSSTFGLVEEIIKNVKELGDEAIKRYTRQFDSVTLSNLEVTDQEIEAASRRIPKEIKRAFKVAKTNIEKFHRSQVEKRKVIETSPGVICFREPRAIERVGLYIPGGTAPLPSTVLMLAIPAKIAGCREIVVSSPPQKDGQIPDVILYACRLSGITKIIKIGGAQAIAALAYGTLSVPKVFKIFGPGNQYVTAAKMLISIDPEGAAIDLPAGPTELLIIADKNARADFVASDLLSQAEHGVDSQVVLVCTNKNKALEILAEVDSQLSTLPRKVIAKETLKNSFCLIAPTIKQAIEFSNDYAPEHLILNVLKPELYIKRVESAGSVFLGQYSPESAGDYASGTNHTLPTYGYARSYSGVSLDSFAKQITFQKLSLSGAQNIGPTVSQLAKTENLEGHRRAMEIRYKSGSQ